MRASRTPRTPRPPHPQRRIHVDSTLRFPRSPTRWCAAPRHDVNLGYDRQARRTNNERIAVQKTIDVAATIDGQRIGGFQLRVFLLCAAVLFVDGFDVQGINYVAPAISQDWK